MSGKIWGKVIDAELPSLVKLTALIMADRVSHDGTGMFYAIPTLARKTGLSERTVQRQMRWLETRKPPVLRKVREADRRRPTEYQLDPAALDLLIRGDGPSPHHSGVTAATARGDSGDTPGVTPTTSRGDSGDSIEKATTDPTTDPTPGDSSTALPPTAAAAVPSPAAEPQPQKWEGTGSVVAEIPLAQTSDPTFRVRTSLVVEYAKDFPALDILAELGAIRRWNTENPRKRKTRDGIRRHITTWLQTAQNDPRKRASARAGTPRATEAAARPFPKCIRCGKPATGSVASMGHTCDDHAAALRQQRDANERAKRQAAGAAAKPQAAEVG